MSEGLAIVNESLDVTLSPVWLIGWLSFSSCILPWLKLRLGVFHGTTTAGIHPLKQLWMVKTTKFGLVRPKYWLMRTRMGKWAFVYVPSSNMRPKRLGIWTLSTFCMTCNACFSLFLLRISCLLHMPQAQRTNFPWSSPLSGQRPLERLGMG